MPVTAGDSVGPDHEHGESLAEGRARYEARRKRCGELDEIVKKVIDQVPVSRQYGALRWARALGA